MFDRYRQRVLSGAGWLRVSEPPHARAVIRTFPEDFTVWEIPRFLPEGEGAHLWLEVTKRGANTDWVAGRIARCAGCRRSEVGYAGLKDRHAVTTQWFSVPAGDSVESGWTDWSIPGVHISRAVRHSRKLRRGALAANRFALILRQVESAGVDDLPSRLERVAANGFPNYFGPQRFGREGRNLESAAQWLLSSNARLPRHRQSLYLSATRSFLFNEVLSSRVGAGSWDRLLAGELVMLDGSRSIFPCERPDESLVARCEAGDIHPSGPLPGKGGAQPMAQAAEVERSSLSADGEIIECLARMGVQASRRPLRTIPTDFDWDLKHERGDHILSLEFVLPAGTYATSLLREIVRFEEAGALASRESA